MRRISLFSQSLFALPLRDTIEAVPETGASAVELACAAPHLDRATAEREGGTVAERCVQLGVEVSALSLFTHFTDPALRDAHLKDALYFIGLAPSFGTKVVKITPGPPGSEEAGEEHWTRLKDTLPRVLDAAGEAEVVLAFETHMRQLTDTLAGTQRLLDMTDSAALGVTLDFSNLVFAGEDIVAAIRAMGPRIVNAHVKNGYIDEAGGWHFGPLDEGWTNYPDVFAALDEIGYSGYLTVECLGPDAQRAPRETAARDIAILKRMLEEHDAHRRD